MNASEYLKRSVLYRKLIHGPHQEFARVYAARMLKEGLSLHSTRRSLSLFRDLMDWYVGNGHRSQDLGEAHVDRFLEHRFEHWSLDTGDRSALRRLLSALRDEDLYAASLTSTLLPSQNAVNLNLCRKPEVYDAIRDFVA